MPTLRLATLFAFATLSSVTAKEQVVVVVGLGAPDLEHVAAQELVTQFKSLFDVTVTLTDHIPDTHQNLVIVGGPAKNKATREVAGDNWPQLSEQGFILRSFDTGGRRGIIVAGKSPVATLWAVCELGHRFGIRYLLREDIYPERQSLDLSGINVLMEPDLDVRAWKTLGDGVTGPESWSVAEQKKLLRQLAKLKFNHIIVSVRPWQPFVNYEFRGFGKQTVGPWRGEQYLIPRDAPGRTAFGTSDSFVNPDFANERTNDEMIAAGIKHLRGIISTAQRLGLSVGLELAPFEFPHEFERAIPGLVAVPRSNDLAVRPGPSFEPHNAALSELAAAQLRAYAETYPDIDSLHFALPETDGWLAAATSIWQQLQKQLGAEAPQLRQRPATEFEANPGVLSQSDTRRLEMEIHRLRNSGGHGFSLRSAMLAELDPTIHYLSRRAWDEGVTPHTAHDDLFATITGGQAVADRLWLGFGHIESATKLTASRAREFASPSSDMMMKHYRGEPVPEWWEELNQHYTQAMIELYRSHGAADPRARALLFYYAKRSEYVLEYLACVKSVRAAALAQQNGDGAGAIEQLEAALESLYNAIDTLGDVAQDPSDRGLIAALNVYAYRPLFAEYERLLESQ